MEARGECPLTAVLFQTLFFCLVLFFLREASTGHKLLDLVRINTELAVKSTSKKAFRKLPNLSGAITALTNLKGIGPATASAILAAAFPEQAPYMADESMLSTPGVEATDYTLAEYLNYAERIKDCTRQLAQKDPDAVWTPHKVELVLWAHYVARELKPSLLDDLSKHKDKATANGSDNHHGAAAASNGAAPEDAPLSSPSDSRSSADLAQVTGDESSSQDVPAGNNNGTAAASGIGDSAEDDSSSSAVAADDAVVPDVSSSSTGKGAKRDLDAEDDDEASTESDKKKARA
ncbi:hypothetical protein HPB48_009601 [Haemaphysalis longicornis]|uniref:Uncharacterized protein n=1 Tax=Haemaphysalis longicornis TaxID=44386 RepID=A0A9J6FR12_HAELO|nr:hypothetical protein HPB48_009601 [Haemaphysalis longicornis]